MPQPAFGSRQRNGPRHNRAASVGRNFAVGFVSATLSLSFLNLPIEEHLATILPFPRARNRLFPRAFRNPKRGALFCYKVTALRPKAMCGASIENPVTDKPAIFRRVGS